MAPLCSVHIFTGTIANGTLGVMSLQLTVNDSSTFCEHKKALLAKKKVSVFVEVGSQVSDRS